MDIKEKQTGMHVLRIPSIEWTDKYKVKRTKRDSITETQNYHGGLLHLGFYLDSRYMAEYPKHTLTS